MHGQSNGKNDKANETCKPKHIIKDLTTQVRRLASHTIVLLNGTRDGKARERGGEVDDVQSNWLDAQGQ